MGSDGSVVNLPPGFRFSPSDEELVLHFLYRKAALLPCHPDIIHELDYPLDPWQLDGKAFSSGKQWYFFRKMMDKQVTENGFWKQLDFEEPVCTDAGKKIGIKKYLVYCVGEGVETSWMMQEYHLCICKFCGTSQKRSKKLKNCCKWVLCRVYQRTGSFSHGVEGDDDDNGSELSCLDEMFLSLDDELEEISLPN
ncbi:hypothetical protein Tsubulata_030056 [Turnera subulata]|uniref:NAC domain-containing protein n=1 Tax=Turnera subulata TaxID=218843 RepID=A0A9Q0FL78_9ROSI|nr:hypothetical protein Tsubulata_030056 [Turnera subulata]